MLKSFIMESKIIGPTGQQPDDMANQGDVQGAWTKIKPRRRVSNFLSRKQGN